MNRGAEILEIDTPTRIGHLLHIEGRVICVVVLGIQVFLQIAQDIAETLEVYDFPFAQELERIAHIRVVDQAQQVVVSCARLLLWCTVCGTTLRLIGMPCKPSDRKGTGGHIAPALGADIGKGQTDKRVCNLPSAQFGMNIGVIDVYNSGFGKGEGNLG